MNRFVCAKSCGCNIKFNPKSHQALNEFSSQSQWGGLFSVFENKSASKEKKGSILHTLQANGMGGPQAPPGYASAIKAIYLKIKNTTKYLLKLKPVTETRQSIKAIYYIISQAVVCTFQNQEKVYLPVNNAPTIKTVHLGLISNRLKAKCLSVFKASHLT